MTSLSASLRAPRGKSATPLLAATLWSAACIASLVAGSPERAAACSPSSCTEAEFFPARGSVPANLPAVLFWPPSRLNSSADDAGPDSVAPSDLRFVRLDAAGPVDVPFDLVPSNEPSTRLYFGSNGAPAYRIVPAAELQAGARYAVWARNCTRELASAPPREPYEASEHADALLDGVPPPRAPYAVFDVTAAAALPSALGNVMVSAPMQHEVQLGGGAGCFDQYEASTVLAEVERAGSPFFDAIAFVTYVDGEVYRPSPNLNYAPAYGDSWIGHGRDELAASCGSGLHALALGKHTLHFEGRVSGSDVTLVGESVEFELPSCMGGTDGGGADGGSLDARDAAAAEGANQERARVHERRGPGGCALAGEARGGVLAALLALVFLRTKRSSLAATRS